MAVQDDKTNRSEAEFIKKKVKFEVYGDEIIEKIVNSSGNSGRVYLPPEWIGRKVKVIKC